MSYACALQYEQIWFLTFNERRQSSAMSAVPQIRLSRPHQASEDTV